MKVSEIWLKSIIHTPLSIEKIAEVLTNAGIEVEDTGGLVPNEYKYEETYHKLGDGSKSLGEELLNESKKGRRLTLKIPANRGDCLCMEGVARELSLLTKLPFQPIEVKAIQSSAKTSSLISVEVKDPDLCPRYLGRVITKVNANAVTPDWIKDRLELADIRSHSAIVDILNYVMIELGQPLHAFDVNQITSPIVVRRSIDKETIELLDGKTVALKAGTLVIADKQKPQAIAGVMGGLKSSVTDKTTDIFIESAYFDPINIRLISQNCGLRTDSSQRFERGVDYHLQERALNRATELLLETVGGQAGDIIEQISPEHLPKPPEVLLRKSRIIALLGSSPSDNEIMDILIRAEMKVELQKEKDTGKKAEKDTGKDNTVFKVIPPSHRQDIALEVDLIEEIARVYGFERFPAEKIVVALEYNQAPEKTISLDVFKQNLIARGYFEALNYSFIDPKNIELFFPGTKPHLLANPISQEMAAMRPSLWPGLLQAVVNNQHRQRSRVRLFELGTCFTEKMERTVLSGVCSGAVYPEQWGIPTKVHDFYDIKNDVQALLSNVDGAEHIQFLPLESGLAAAALHPGQAAKIILKDKTLGVIGALHPRIIQALDVTKPVYVFELEVSALSARIPESKDLSKFPAIRRDLAVIVPQAIFAEELKSAIVNCVGEGLREVVIFDVYQGPGIEPGKKSIALGLILQDPSRTLIDEDVTLKINEVVGMLAKKFGATLRE